MLEELYDMCMVKMIYKSILAKPHTITIAGDDVPSLPLRMIEWGYIPISPNVAAHGYKRVSSIFNSQIINLAYC